MPRGWGSRQRSRSPRREGSRCAQLAVERGGLGGAGTIPWRAAAAEEVLIGAAPGTAVFREAAEAAIVDPFTVSGTAFKVELAKRTIVRTLETVAG